VTRHPLWSPYSQPTQEEVDAARIDHESWAVEPVEVVRPDPAWTVRFDTVSERVRAALGERVLGLEHVGSTSVPGLWAKPVIDVDLIVASSADEDTWLPDLEAAGFVLRVREPGWEEHRLVRGEDPTSNVHVWSVGAKEPRKHAMFRDWLRTHDDDRALYADAKRAAAARGFTDVMQYNNEKAWVIYDIYEKAFAADPEHEHEPAPRE